MTDSIDEAVEIAASLCRSFEGLRLKPYLCPAGYPTIGYGTVWKPDGTQVKLDDPPITKQKAEEWLISELTRSYLPGVLRASPGLISNPRALGAITDFAYNLGVGDTAAAHYAAESTRQIGAALFKKSSSGIKRVDGYSPAW